MIIRIIKKKASSLKELAHEDIEIPKVEILKELLIAISIVEFNLQHQNTKLKILDAEEIKNQARLGKVSFSNLYNDQKEELNKAINVMLQDYNDGLFRVYLNQQECLDLNEALEINDNDEVVLIRLMMLAGRLW